MNSETLKNLSGETGSGEHRGTPTRLHHEAMRDPAGLGDSAQRAMAQHLKTVFNTESDLTGAYQKYAGAFAAAGQEPLQPEQWLVEKRLAVSAIEPAPKTRLTGRGRGAREITLARR